MSEYADMVEGVMNKSSGHVMLLLKIAGLPSKRLENRFEIPPLLEVRWLGAVVDPLSLPVPDESGRMLPWGKRYLSLSTFLSISAEVPTLARSIAVFRSCSLITAEDECGFAPNNLVRSKACTSRKREMAKSAWRVKK
jgi:hypothetical protein